MNTFKPHELSSIEECRKLAEQVFGKKWQELEDKVYSQGPETKVDSWGIGNCHIDTAWLVSRVLRFPFFWLVKASSLRIPC